MWWLEYRCHLFFWEDSLASTGSLLVGWTLEEVLVAQMIHPEEIPVLCWIQSGYIYMDICECKYKYILNIYCVFAIIYLQCIQTKVVYIIRYMYMKNTWVHVSQISGWTLKWSKQQLRSILLDTGKQDGIWGYTIWHATNIRFSRVPTANCWWTWLSWGHLFPPAFGAWFCSALYSRWLLNAVCAEILFGSFWAICLIHINNFWRYFFPQHWGIDVERRSAMILFGRLVPECSQLECFIVSLVCFFPWHDLFNLVMVSGRC